MNADRTLPVRSLESVYDALARAVDQAGPDKADLFLIKLALLNAQVLADEALILQQIEAALSDL